MPRPAAEAVERAQDREAERAAEIDAVGENEPVAHQPPGRAGNRAVLAARRGDGCYELDVPEPVAEFDAAEPEMEL